MDRGSVDCSYVYGLIYYGVLLFGLFMVGYFFLIRHLLKEKRGAEVALVLGIVAAGFTEPFQFNFSFKNLVLPFLGNIFSGCCASGRNGVPFGRVAFGEGCRNGMRSCPGPSGRGWRRRRRMRAPEGGF